MKILVISSENDKTLSDSLKDALRPLYLPINVFCGTDISADYGASLFDAMEKANHYCIIVPKDISSNWFLFASAYCLGKNTQTCLYTEEKRPGLPVFLNSLPHYMQPGALFEYFSEKRKQWKWDNIKTSAAERLAALGIPYNEEGLFRAVAEGNIKAVELFRKTNFPVNIKDKKGVPLLNIAVRNNHRIFISHILSGKVDLDALSEDRNNTALMDAAAEGYQEILEDLIKAGADLNRQSKNGQTALILSIGRGFTECAEKLIKAGADLAIKDKLGMDAVMYAKLFNKQDLVDIIKSLSSIP